MQRTIYQYGESSLNVKKFNWKIVSSLIILVIVFTVGYILLLVKENVTSLDFEGIQRIIYLSKVVSILWLVSLPIFDYFLWAKNASLIKSLYAIPMIYLILVTGAYLFGAILSVKYEDICDFFLNRNEYFFIHTLATLFALAYADFLIIKYIEQDLLKVSPPKIELVQKTIDQLRKTSEKNKVDDQVLESHLREYYSLLSKNFVNNALLRRYKATFKYADLSIFLSVLVTFFLYLSLSSVFKITGAQRQLYEIFFEGAHIFSLIISTFIYFIIVAQYGSKPIHNN